MNKISKVTRDKITKLWCEWIQNKKPAKIRTSAWQAEIIFRAGAEIMQPEIDGLQDKITAARDYLMETEDDRDYKMEEVFELLGYQRNGLGL